MELVRAVSLGRSRTAIETLGPLVAVLHHIVLLRAFKVVSAVRLHGRERIHVVRHHGAAVLLRGHKPADVALGVADRVVPSSAIVERCVTLGAWRRRRITATGIWPPTVLVFLRRFATHWRRLGDANVRV